jgi:hypothetical protein
MQFCQLGTFIIKYKLISDVKEDQILVHFVYVIVQINHTVVFWPHFYNIPAICLKPMKTDLKIPKYFIVHNHVSLIHNYRHTK